MSWFKWCFHKKAQSEHLQLKINLGVTTVFAESDLLDTVDAPLIGLRDVQRAQVGQGDGLGSLQRGAHRCPAHQMVVNAWNLAVDWTPCHDTHLKTLWNLKKYTFTHQLC